MFLSYACLLTLRILSCHPRSIIGFNRACFCSITRWIVSIALGNQATVYTLLSSNFLCMVVMLNGKGLHGTAPKLKTLSRAFNGWCMSGGKEASELYLAAALPSKSSRTGFDISHRLETKMPGSVSLCKRRGVSAQRKVQLFICTNWNSRSQL